MELGKFQPRTRRRGQKRVGRGGKRGTTSGHGTKGQRGRAGASIKPGFRGGDNRLWQVFPKLRGSTKKHGNSRPHRKHRFFMVKAAAQVYAINVEALNILPDGQIVNAKTLFEHGILENPKHRVKILGDGVLKRKLTIDGIPVSKSAVEKITKAGGRVS